MNRYKALIESKNSISKYYHFPSTGSCHKVLKYLKYCKNRNGIFIADNIPERILISSVINFSKMFRSPIIVVAEREARILSLSYSYNNIYSFNNQPKGQFFIYLNCVKKLTELDSIPLLIIIY